MLSTCSEPVLVPMDRGPQPRAAAWPTDLPSATTVIVDEPDQSALALLGLHAPGVAVHAISPYSRRSGPDLLVEICRVFGGGRTGLHRPARADQSPRSDAPAQRARVHRLPPRPLGPGRRTRRHPSDRHGGLADRTVSHLGSRGHRRCHSRRLARARPARRDLGLHADRPVATVGTCPRDDRPGARPHRRPRVHRVAPVRDAHHRARPERCTTARRRRRRLHVRHCARAPGMRRALARRDDTHHHVDRRTELRRRTLRRSAVLRRKRGACPRSTHRRGLVSQRADHTPTSAARRPPTSSRCFAQSTEGRRRAPAG